ncbi:MAG: hypothetical protein JSS32_03230 [Verrucomicrobia bacterium]|nr:hypothetical protein [Verrucomicrobiota bacterium]
MRITECQPGSWVQITNTPWSDAGVLGGNLLRFDQHYVVMKTADDGGMTVLLDKSLSRIYLFTGQGKILADSKNHERLFHENFENPQADLAPPPENAQEMIAEAAKVRDQFSRRYPHLKDSLTFYSLKSNL